MNRFVTLLLFAIILTACEKQPNPNAAEVLIFGEAYGFCVGDCAHLFKLSEGKLYQDNIERFTGDEPTFNAMSLDETQFEVAKDLLRDFPAYLSAHPNQTFGCPDCADQGGIHLFYNTASEKMYWHIDTNVDNQPAEIREYLAQLHAIVNQLK